MSERPTVSAPFASPPAGPAIFDRQLIRCRRTRIAEHFGAHDFLLREAAARMADRLADVRRRFPVAVNFGGSALSPDLRDAMGIHTVIHTDLAEAFARRAGPHSVVADEEWLPFRPACFDLVTSLLTLHRVNDLPGALIQANRCLKPDGLFLAALFGGETLKELRRAWTEAEAAVEGGVSPRIAPFLDIRDAGGLLQRAGFALPVADVDTLTVTYADPLALMRELRGMGETNALVERRRLPLRRETLFKAAEAYRDLFGMADGRIPATVQLIWLTGWAPDESQPKPARRGSATMRLADALNAVGKQSADQERK